MRRALLAVPALLGACATTAPAPPPAGGICRDNNLAAFAGREANAETGAAILAASGARHLRWVQPGMMVTMEYSESRVTVSIGAGNRIERVNCG